ncbi:MAG TPA: hypothetical protein VFP79_10325 [Pseudolabrys sp.]|nr:hypothetical protein [Pseudolabrys sp.]
MTNVFHPSAYVTLGAVFTFVVIAYVLIQSWKRHKFSSERQRAIARLGNLERKQPPEAVGPELTPRHEIEIDRADNSCLWSDPEQATNEKSLLHDPTGSLAADPDVPLEPKSKTAPRLPLLVGTKVQAARNFGPIKEGTPGIITDVADLSFLCWSRPKYVCTFAENKRVHARPRQIAAYEHGYSIEELEQPDFASNLSRQMTLRAQQLFRGQRPSPLRNTIAHTA